MYKVKPSSQKEIKRNKQLLEKVDLFDYALKYNNKIYLHVNYSRFGNVTGLLILDEYGEAIPKEEAIQPLYMFNQYNSYIHDVIDVMIPETRKSLKGYEDVAETLRAIVTDSSPNFAQATLKSFETVIQTRKKQGELVYKIRDIQNKILDEVGYLTETDLEAIKGYSEAFTVGQYNIAMAHLNGETDVKMTIEWLEKSGTENAKLISLLKSHISQRSMNIMKKSYERYLVDYDGNAVHYSPDENGTEKWLEVYREMITKSKEKNILPKLRNA